MRHAEEILALPLWINGRAYLTVTASFSDIQTPGSERVLRRAPVCGDEELQAALVSARAALPAWAGLSQSAREGLIEKLAVAVAAHAAHLAGLIAAETGVSEATAAAELDAALRAFGGRSASVCQGVLAVWGGDALSSVLAELVPAWLEGACVIVRPVAGAPSAVYALAELSARCGFPAGVFNVLYGDQALAEALRRAGIPVRGP